MKETLKFTFMTMLSTILTSWADKVIFLIFSGFVLFVVLPDNPEQERIKIQKAIEQERLASETRLRQYQRDINRLRK